jgi:two-component system, chemotaxis family, chemotaxis protein CheY
MCKVLIVDDSASMRTKIKTMVEKYGFKVVGEAENGIEGVKKYIELQPDIVSLDIRMPKMSGFEALRCILAYDPKAKVIMIAKIRKELIVKRSMEYGAKAFIAKPLDEHEIVKIFYKQLE